MVEIRLDGVTKRYGEMTARDDVSFTAREGEFFTLVGPSGCGKTTTLRTIAGFESPTEGGVYFGDREMTGVPPEERGVGIVFQSYALFPHLNVFDNVAFPLREHTRLSESLVRHLVLAKLQAVGLRGARNLMPSELSGGMARRVALARAMALDPMMIMYDEPFTGQDPISMGVLIKLISTVNQALGVSSVVVSHDVPETASIADYIYLIADGKIVDHGAPDELKSRGEGWTRQFFNALPDGPVRFHYPAADYAEDLLGRPGAGGGGR
jgi:phospholipid/cholesterol/gamma-HCH transport system ATP-binding protein